MTKINFESQAPGKVILCGEYSVLEGYPCIVSGVDRFVKAKFSMNDTTSEAHTLSLISPGFIDQTCDLQWNDQQQSWQLPAEKGFHFLVNIINGILNNRPSLIEIFKYDAQLEIDSTALFDQASKLGLGSSAALTVAVFNVLLKAQQTLKHTTDIELTDDEKHWSILHKVHSDVQGKLGSGADIAASLMHTLSVFSNQRHENCTLARYDLPEGLHVTFFWTGQSASTPKYLASLKDWRVNNQRAYKTYMHDLGTHVDHLSKEKSAANFIKHLKAFTQTLASFADATGLSIFGGGHQEVYEDSLQYDTLIYKPCGAGGGDLGMAVSLDKDDLAAFTQQANEKGFEVMQLSLCTHAQITQ